MEGLEGLEGLLPEDKCAKLKSSLAHLWKEHNTDPRVMN